MAVYSKKELTYMTTHPLWWTREEKSDSQLNCTKAPNARQNEVTSMHYNWPKLEYLGGIDLLNIKVPKVTTTQCHTPTWQVYSPSAKPHAKNVQTRPRAKYRDMRSYTRPHTNDQAQEPHTRCGRFLFPMRNTTQSQHRGGPRQNTDVHSHTPPNTCSDQLSMIPHTHSGTFFHCKTPPKPAQMKAKVKYGCVWYYLVLPSTAKPHPPEEYIDKAQGEMWACTATQDPNPQVLNHVKAQPLNARNAINYDTTHLLRWLAQMKAKTKYRCTQAPESPAPEHLQSLPQQVKYNTTHLLRQVPSTAEPHPPEKCTDKTQVKYGHYGATHPPKWVPPLCDTPPDEDHTPTAAGVAIPYHPLHEGLPDESTKTPHPKYGCTKTGPKGPTLIIWNLYNDKTNMA
ncbi:hypothetical protein BS47DRAFT_1369205 [Hydnum rufescens UP504]|uniref:Uncharacterized protein n=1 Tax=Hydnum rufescens UP504 TaxID=1448309 RepID=A0A9P6AEU8_9AGAM|nr:hypothetical protein BS47DRAFT_1369205 [Hydnum rufescens UP504]